MQPKQTYTPPPQPAPETPFDFMLKDQPKQSRFKLGGSKLSKIVIGLAVLLIIVIVLASAGGGSGPSNSAKIVDLMAQSQEIIRVTTTNQLNFKDQNNLALSNTAMVTLTGQKAQFGSYLTKQHIKFKDAQLAARKNSATDLSLQQAITNNDFDTAYDSYLKSALEKYQTSLSALYPDSSQSFKKTLTDAFNSNKVLLAAPELALSPST